jgi:hypothetical protein
MQTKASALENTTTEPPISSNAARSLKAFIKSSPKRREEISSKNSRGLETI